MAAAKQTINPTAGSILGFLFEGPKSGWDLATEIPADIGDFWSITRSQIYRELHSLAAAGLIEAGDPGPRDRVEYAITDEGREVFRSWITSPISVGGIRFPFLLRIRFGSEMPQEMLELALRTFYDEIRANLAFYEEQRALFPSEMSRDFHLKLAALDYGIWNGRAVVQWYESLPESIRGPLEGADQSDDGE